MKNTARKKKLREVEPVVQLTLADVIGADLREFVIAAGTAAIGAVLEHERTQLVGPRYAHLPEREAHRTGSAPGELVLGGRRVQVRRPRARTLGGREVELPSWLAFAAEDPLHERAVEQMLVGVSTRSYARSLEPVPDELVTRGTSRSAVSRRFVAATEKQMAEWLGRDLSAIDLVELMIDGVYVGDDHVMLVALGFDGEGNKHVLGVREGATENAASCTALLTEMRDRGLRTERPVLAVVDGSFVQHARTSKPATRMRARRADPMPRVALRGKNLAPATRVPSGRRSVLTPSLADLPDRLRVLADRAIRRLRSMDRPAQFFQPRRFALVERFVHHPVLVKNEPKTVPWERRMVRRARVRLDNLGRRYAIRVGSTRADPEHQARRRVTARRSVEGRVTG
jgi:hypothetical protein